MDRYEVVAPQGVTINPGTRLVLTKAQAEPRAHNLKALSKGRYLVERTVMFKLGETLGIEGDVNKTLVAALEKKKAKAGGRDKDAAKAKGD